MGGVGKKSKTKLGCEVGKKVKLNLDVKNIFARSHSEHCWRCSSTRGD